MQLTISRLRQERQPVTNSNQSYLPLIKVGNATTNWSKHENKSERRQTPTYLASTPPCSLLISNSFIASTAAFRYLTSWVRRYARTRRDMAWPCAIAEYQPGGSSITPGNNLRRTWKEKKYYSLTTDHRQQAMDRWMAHYADWYAVRHEPEKTVSGLFVAYELTLTDQGRCPWEKFVNVIHNAILPLITLPLNHLVNHHQYWVKCPIKFGLITNTPEHFFFNISLV